MATEPIHDGVIKRLGNLEGRVGKLESQHADVLERLHQMQEQFLRAEKRQEDHRRTAISVSEAQLREMRSQTNLLETVLRRVNYMQTAMEAVPCIRQTGVDDDDCPEDEE